MKYYVNNYLKNKSIKERIRKFLPSSKRYHRILSGRLEGKRIVTSWYDYPAAILGRTERPLLSWFSNNIDPGETWLDIGAHYGYTAIALSCYVGTKGRVFAFEPVLCTAGYLTQTRVLNGCANLTVIPLGLGNSDKISIIQLPTVRGMADSIIDQSGWTENIILSSLDWIWPKINNGDERINGIKIDVQGMEIMVLQGMREYLRSYKPKLIIEVHADVDRDELLDILKRAGYDQPAIPIEPIEGEVEPRYIDNRSYVFQ